MMGHKQKISQIEYDSVSEWKQKPRPGIRKWHKRKMSKRARREAKSEVATA